MAGDGAAGFEVFQLNCSCVLHEQKAAWTAKDDQDPARWPRTWWDVTLALSWPSLATLSCFKLCFKLCFKHLLANYACENTKKPHRTRPQNPGGTADFSHGVAPAVVVTGATYTSWTPVVMPLGGTCNRSSLWLLSSHKFLPKMPHGCCCTKLLFYGDWWENVVANGLRNFSAFLRPSQKIAKIAFFHFWHARMGVDKLVHFRSPIKIAKKIALSMGFHSRNLRG